MAKWTETPEEYTHVRRITVEGPIYGRVIVHMRDGRELSGLLTGLNTGNDVGENLNAGKGPVVTSIWGEIRMQLADGTTVTLDALDIADVHSK